MNATGQHGRSFLLHESVGRQLTAEVTAYLRPGCNGACTSSFEARGRAPRERGRPARTFFLQPASDLPPSLPRPASPAYTRLKINNRMVPVD